MIRRALERDADGLARCFATLERDRKPDGPPAPFAAFRAKLHEVSRRA